MADELLLAILLTSVPLILAATGELVAEKSGVLNLGVEGMMLMGAVAAFGVASLTGSPYLGILGGGLAGLLISLIFAVFVLGLATNQVATGLALTIFGTGLSGLIGAPLVGQSIDGLPSLIIPWISDIPMIGAFFRLDFLAYLAVVLVGLTTYVLNHTQFGLVLRAVGINHDSAHALGYPVLRVRFMAVLFGGFMAGLGGGYLPLVLTPHWAEGMTSGRGWIALALVVFASWRPWRVTAGAILFGGITIMQLVGQARGWAVPSQFLSMLPYFATIVVLVLISRGGRAQFGAPAHLGKNFLITR